MTEPTLQDRLRLSCNRKHCNCTSAQAAREIDRLQAGMADAIRRAEKAEAELNALAEQEPIIYDWWSEATELWLPCDDKDQANRCIEKGRKIRSLYARPIPAEHTQQPATVGYAAYPIPQEWLEVMKELADDAQYYCDMQYPYRDRYHRDMVKYNAEMDIVHRARELLERAK